MSDCMLCAQPLEGATIPFRDGEGMIHADSSECRPCPVCGEVVEGTAVLTDNGYEHIGHGPVERDQRQMR